MRLLAIEACSSIASLLSKEDIESSVVATLSNASKVSINNTKCLCLSPQEINMHL